jgi:spermidine/putrescine transport system ATP-binding protein
VSESTGHTETDVRFTDVVKRFADVVAVDGVSFAVRSNSFYSLLGPSGCGKTTSLRLIAGFEQPTDGSIEIGGRPVAGVPPHRREVNTVFQHYALFPHMDVASNVGYGLRQRRPKLDRSEIHRRVNEALELVRLSGYGPRRSWELSGGQQQRVALARALVMHPRVLLLDEPLGALDLKLRKEMQLELKHLQREVGITFIYVTHDQEEALTMSDRIAVMYAGKIQQEGPPAELYDHPVNRFVADFIGQSNFFEGIVAEPGEPVKVRLERGLTLRAPIARSNALLNRGDHVVLSIRPERVHLDPTGADLPAGRGGTDGTVAETTFLGDQVEFVVDAPVLGRVIARMNHRPGSTEHRFAPGDQVQVSWLEEAAVALIDPVPDREEED